MSKTPPQPPRPPGAHRPSQAGPPGLPGGRSADVERALALRDVMDHVVEVQKEITAPKKLRRPRGRLILAAIICVPLLALCVYSWVARPEFIWGPRALPVPSQRREANVRFSMFLLARRIQSYRRTEGALPSSLAAIAARVPGISYAVVSDSVFELRTEEGGKPIVLRSDASVSDFLGDAAKIVAGRVK